MKLASEDLRTLLQVARTIFESGVCPKEITNEKAAFAVMLAGAELGLGPMQSLRCIQIVKGKLSFTSEFTVAQVVADPRCKYFRLVESTDKVATFETHREGNAEPARLSWTMQMAQRAGLASRSDTWKSHPEAMLRARCAMALARAIYPDLTNGVRLPDEVEEIERETAPAPVAQLPARNDAPVAAPSDQPAQPQQPAQPPPVQQPTSTDPPPVLTGFCQRVEAIELPGEAVAVWLKHREDLGAAGQEVHDKAWQVLCEKTRAVGKMAKPEVWLSKAIAEEDLRAGRPPQPAEPPAVSNYRARCASAPSLDALTAVCLEMAPTVSQHREAAWGLAVRRAADLGGDEAVLKDLVEKAAHVTREPAVWKVAADVLIGFAAATDRAGVAAVVKRHGGAVQKLPKLISTALIKARDVRLAEVTPTDAAAVFESEMRAASDIPTLEAVGDKIAAAARDGKITPEQLKVLAALQDKIMTAMEMEPAA